MGTEDLQGLVPSNQTPQIHSRPASNGATSRSAISEDTVIGENSAGPFVDFKILREVLDYQKEVKELRQNLLVERVRLREDRNALTGTRQRASDAASKFTDAVRSLQDGTKNADSKTLAVLYEDVMQSRDAYGAAETEYTQQEQKFYDEEHLFNSKDWKLNKMENELYSLLEDARTHDIGRARAPSSPVAMLQDPHGIVSQPKTEQASLYEQYESQVGRIEMLRERLGDLSLEQAEHVEDQRERRARNLEIDSDNQDFLEQFPYLYDQTFEELRFVNRNLHSLRDKLIEAGYDLNLSLYDTSELIPPYPLSPDPTTPRPRSPAKSESALSHMLEHYSSMRKRIGEWILGNLVSSPIERARHKAALENENLDNDEWWRLVKYFWERDAASKADLKQDMKSIRIAESYRSSKSMELGTPHESSGLRQTLDSTLWTRTDTSQSSKSQNSSVSTSPQTRPTTTAESTDMDFTSAIGSENLIREATIQIDDDFLDSVTSPGNDSSFSQERNLRQDLNLQEALQFWTFLDQIEDSPAGATSDLVPANYTPDSSDDQSF